MAQAGDGDKRSVSTDALDTLGTILGPSEKRDAIHLAVEPVVAKEWLPVGANVTVDGRRGPPDKWVGIVDPFLKEAVQPGERFWLVVYPRQIHSLRHVWTHPAFPEVPEVIELNEVRDVSIKDPVLITKIPADSAAGLKKAASEKWLRDYCERADCPPYEVLIAAAVGGAVENVAPDYYDHSYELDGDVLHFSGYDAHGDIPAEFWDHVEIVSGKKIDISERAKHFSCSC